MTTTREDPKHEEPDLSGDVYMVDEVEPGVFQSVFPTRLSERSSLHTTRAEAWEYIDEVRNG